MQPERSAQLAHTQVPLQRFGVVRESESLLASLPERNRLTQTVNELKRRRQKRISQPEPFTSSVQQQQRRRGSILPERVGPERAGGGIFSGR